MLTLLIAITIICIAMVVYVSLYYTFARLYKSWEDEDPELEDYKEYLKRPGIIKAIKDLTIEYPNDLL